MTISFPIKIVALIGVLAAAGVFLGMPMLSQSSSSPSVVKVIKPLHPVKKAHVTTVHATTPAKKVTVTKTTTAHKKVVHVKVQPKPKVVAAAPVTPVPAAANGLPARVNEALREYSVVVVSLYDPEASVDATSLGEAAAGAKMAKVGFLAINVLDQAQASPFTDALGVLQDPTLLIYARPGTLTFKVDGFADREVVAQAALSAKRTT
jgi:hypothetical protein